LVDRNLIQFSIKYDNSC